VHQQCTPHAYLSLPNSFHTCTNCQPTDLQVCLWAASDDLAAHYENDVAALLTLWSGGKEGQACSEEELAQLGRLVGGCGAGFVF